MDLFGDGNNIMDWPTQVEHQVDYDVEVEDASSDHESKDFVQQPINIQSIMEEVVANKTFTHKNEMKSSIEIYEERLANQQSLVQSKIDLCHGGIPLSLKGRLPISKDGHFCAFLTSVVTAKALLAVTFEIVDVCGRIPVKGDALKVMTHLISCLLPEEPTAYLLWQEQTKKGIDQRVRGWDWLSYYDPHTNEWLPLATLLHKDFRAANSKRALMDKLTPIQQPKQRQAQQAAPCERRGNEYTICSEDNDILIRDLRIEFNKLMESCQDVLKLKTLLNFIKIMNSTEQSHSITPPRKRRCMKSSSKPTSSLFVSCRVKPSIEKMIDNPMEHTIWNQNLTSITSHSFKASLLPSIPIDHATKPSLLNKLNYK